MREELEGGKAVVASRLLAAAVAVLLVAWCLREDVQPDLYFHLAAGRLLWRAGLPDRNVFLAVHPDHPFVDHEWLFQALVWPLHALGGPALLTLFKTLVAGVCLAALAGAAARHGRHVRWAVAVPALALMGPRLVLRPEVLTFAGVALVLWRLHRDRFRPGRPTLLMLGALQVVWSNAHGVSLLGPVIVALALGACLVHRALDHQGLAGRLPAPGDPRRLVLLLAVQLGAALLNPYGPRASFYAAWHVLTSTGDDPLAGRIVELASPFAAGVRERWEVRLAMAWTLAAAPLWGLALWRRRARLEDAAIGAGLVLLATPYVRNLPLVALGLFVPTAAGLGALARRVLDRAPRDRAPVVRVAGALATAVVALGFARAVLADRVHENADHDARAGLGLGDFLRYDEAAAFLREARPAALFNTFGSGHHLLWACPEVPPFICGNVDLYPREHLRRYHALMDGSTPWRAELDALGVSHVLLDHRVEVPAFLDPILGAPGWTLVHADDHAVVLARDASGVAAVDRAALAQAWLTRSFADEQPDRFAPTRALRALGLLPQRAPRPITRLHVARLLERLGRPGEALALARRARELAPDFAPAVLAAAELERAHGDPATAERLYALGVELIADEPTPWIGLAKLATRRARVLLAQAEVTRGSRAGALRAEGLAAAQLARQHATAALERTREGSPEAAVSIQELLNACELSGDAVELRRAVASLPLPRARARYFEGVAAYLERDHARAATLLEEALALEPDLVPALGKLAWIRNERGDLAGAEDALARLTAVTPRDPAAWRDLAQVRQALGRLDGDGGAIVAWRRSIEVDPAPVDARVVAARALAASRPEVARELVTQALARNPKHSEALRLQRSLPEH